MDSYLVLIANSKDDTVSSFELADGRISPIGVTDIGAPGPYAVDLDRDLVFAGVKEPPAIEVLRADRASGELREWGSYPARGVPVYLALSPDGGVLCGASYHQGVGESWLVDSDGVLEPAGGPINFGNLHSVQVSADGQHAYFVSLLDDLIAQYALGTDGSLTPLDPPTVAAPEGSGPRHIILSADQRSVYVNTEFSGEALHYRRDPGTGVLEFVSAARCVPDDRGLSHSRFGASPRAEDLIWGSDLHLDAAERLLYCAERTRATITAVEVAPDGSLGAPVAHSDVVAQPRAFAVLPGGELLVASEIDSVIALYQPDGQGALTEIERHDVGLGANWIEVLPRS